LSTSQGYPIKRETLVCKLIKEIPSWFDAASHHSPFSLGFRYLVILLVYDDDIIITGPNSNLIHQA
ncbi:hypothetical protein CR513_09020, partial [Mucuna pruriens]